MDYREALAKNKESKARASRRRLKSKELVGMGQLRISSRPTDKQLDDLWGEVVKLRDKKKSPLCRICSLRPGTTAYHIIPKNYGRATRWALENGVLSCSGCNMAEMMNRLGYLDKHKQLFGTKFVEDMMQRARIGRGFSPDRWVIFAMLSQELKKLKEPVGENKDQATDRQERRDSKTGPAGQLGDSKKDVPPQS
jgi:5-methylcytosine-specific restriction endonuclease McrA